MSKYQTLLETIVNNIRRAETLEEIAHIVNTQVVTDNYDLEEGTSIRWISLNATLKKIDIDLAYAVSSLDDIRRAPNGQYVENFLARARNHYNIYRTRILANKITQQGSQQAGLNLDV